MASVSICITRKYNKNEADTVDLKALCCRQKGENKLYKIKTISAGFAPQ